MMMQARSFTMGMHRRALRWVAVAALLCAMPAPARADAPAAMVEEAKVLFQQARAAIKQGDLPQALVLFRKSYRRHSAAGTLLNMASCEEQIGLTASAWLHYQRLAAELRVDDERLPLTKKRIVALKPRVARLQIKLASGVPSGTKVMQNDVELPQADLGAALLVDPIKHVIVVTAPGRQERRYEVTVAEGEQETLTVEPGQASVIGTPLIETVPTTPAPSTAAPTKSAPIKSAPTPAPITPAPSSKSRARTTGFIVGGAGIAGLGVGTIMSIVGFVKSNDAEGTGQTLAVAGPVAFLGGLSALCAGTYLVLSNREKPATTAAIAPLVLPSGAGLGASGSF